MEEASTTSKTSTEITRHLLTQVVKAIEIDHSNFDKFINILERTVKYKPLVVDIRDAIRSYINDELIRIFVVHP